MFKAIVSLQWKSARAWIIVAMLAVAALPFASVTRTWPTDPDRFAIFLAELDLWSVFYPLTAVVVGVTISVLTWRSDRRGDFVYALTLPVARWRYVLLRFGASAVWLGAIAVALWLAAMIAVATVSMPATLSSHPHRLAAKFALALLSVFGLAFAGAALPQKVRRGVAWTVVVVLALQFGLSQLGIGEDWLRLVAESLVGPGGPLAALGGRWMLIDV